MIPFIDIHCQNLFTKNDLLNLNSLKFEKKQMTNTFRVKFVAVNLKYGTCMVVISKYIFIY